MKRILITMAIILAVATAADAGRFIGLGFFRSIGEIVRTAFTVTDGGGETFRVTDGGGEDFNVR